MIVVMMMMHSILSLLSPVAFRIFRNTYLVVVVVRKVGLDMSFNANNVFVVTNKHEIRFPRLGPLQ